MLQLQELWAGGKSEMSTNAHRHLISLRQGKERQGKCYPPQRPCREDRVQPEKGSEGSPSGSVGIPVKMTRYVVRKTAPSAGSSAGPPAPPPAPSSRPSGSRYTRKPSRTHSSPGNRRGRSSLGYSETGAAPQDSRQAPGAHHSLAGPHSPSGWGAASCSHGARPLRSQCASGRCLRESSAQAWALANPL